MKEIQFAVANAITVSNNFCVSYVKEGKLEDLLLIVSIETILQVHALWRRYKHGVYE
jgi:hypothetical protein